MTGSLLALACLAACASPATEAGRGHDGTAGRAGGGEVSPERVFALGADLDELLSDHMETCMDQRGHPQLRDAAALTVQRDPRGRRAPLTADLLEAGPYSDAQARQYGVLGVGALFQDDEPGHVISADPAYDAATAACWEEFDGPRGIDSIALLSAVDQLRNDMRTQFLQELDGRIEGLLAARSNCVRRNGYPSLVADPGASIADTLASVGIPLGEHSGPRPPAPEDVAPGVVLVLPPATRPVYRPTQAEVDFALVLVRCGEQELFAERWAEAQREPRRIATEEFRDQVAGLGEALATALAGTDEATRD